MLHINYLPYKDAYEAHVAFVLVAMRTSFDVCLIKKSSPLPRGFSFHRSTFLFCQFCWKFWFVSG